jgi:hypothetical protein
VQCGSTTGAKVMSIRLATTVGDHRRLVASTWSVPDQGSARCGDLAPPLVMCGPGSVRFQPFYFDAIKAVGVLEPRRKGMTKRAVIGT